MRDIPILETHLPLTTNKTQNDVDVNTKIHGLIDNITTFMQPAPYLLLLWLAFRRDFRTWKVLGFVQVKEG